MAKQNRKGATPAGLMGNGQQAGRNAGYEFGNELVPGMATGQSGRVGTAGARTTINAQGEYSR